MYVKSNWILYSSLWLCQALGREERFRAFDSAKVVTSAKPRLLLQPWHSENLPGFLIRRKSRLRYSNAPEDPMHGGSHTPLPSCSGERSQGPARVLRHPDSLNARGVWELSHRALEMISGLVTRDLGSSYSCTKQQDTHGCVLLPLLPLPKSWPQFRRMKFADPVFNTADSLHLCITKNQLFDQISTQQWRNSHSVWRNSHSV